MNDGPPLSVHVLGEHVFCPRAAVIARETEVNDSEPTLGPRLNGLYDWDGARLDAEIVAAWDAMFWNLTFLAPSAVGCVALGTFVSMLVGVVAAGPAVFFLGRAVDSLRTLVDFVKQRAAYRIAPEQMPNLPPSVPTPVSWWTLRKAGFECLKPADAYRDGERLVGKPWRLLTRGVTRIPVVRRHRRRDAGDAGPHTWNDQHLIRLSAYSELIEKCEGADSPFGVVLFAGTYDCVVAPTSSTSAELARDVAVERAQEFFTAFDRGIANPPPPGDGRCGGCPHGAPDSQGRSACGERFGWVPPYRRQVPRR